MRPKDFYPDGYPREHSSQACHNVNDMLGAICVIDNKHEGRPHFGPDGTGVYRQWTSSLLLSLPSASQSCSANGS